MKRRIAWVLCCLMAVGAVAWAAEDSTVVFDETLAYAVADGGATLSVWLGGNATTGYEWVCGLPEDALLAAQPGVYEAEETGLAGSGGVTLFTLETGEAGEGLVTVRFDYARAWETDGPVLAYELDVRVEPDGLLAVETVRRVIPAWQEGDLMACPECGQEEAVVTAVVTGGDEENGAAYFLTVECEKCGEVETVE